jgi:hypothetical protein
MKKIVFNIIVFSLVAFCFIGCATQSNKTKAEVWHDVKSLDEFIGKWEGSFVQNIPKNDENAMPKTSMEITIFFECIQGEEVVNGYMNVDFTQMLTDWSNMEMMKNAGVTIEFLWELITERLEGNEEINIGGEYFITQDLSGDVDTFFSEDSGKFQINESGSKLKLVFNQAVSFGLGDSGFTEIVLNKMN